MNRAIKIHLYCFGLAILSFALCFPADDIRGTSQVDDIIIGILLSIVMLSLSASIAAVWYFMWREQQALGKLVSLTYCLAGIAFSFFGMGLLNDVIFSLKFYYIRYLIFLGLYFAVFVIPWVYHEYKYRGKTPIIFDAFIPVFLALNTFPLTLLGLPLRYIDLTLPWDQKFWLIRGGPSVAITYLLLRFIPKFAYKNLIIVAVITLCLLLFLTYKISQRIVN